MQIVIIIIIRPVKGNTAHNTKLPWKKNKKLSKEAGPGSKEPAHTLYIAGDGFLEN